MNRTKIEWTDFTWNPVTGCWGPGGTAEQPNRCTYCYAAKIAHRMAHIEGSEYGCGVERPNPMGAFDPRFHPGRLDQPNEVKKPSRIFVCSMGDLFGEWVPEFWIGSVLNFVKGTPQHIFQFLTKNPRRLEEFSPWPENCWVGATATDEESFAEATLALAKVDAKVRFISAEPLLGEIRHFTIQATLIDWLIIGALTRPGAKPPFQHMVQAAGRERIHDLTRPGAKPPFQHWVRGLADWARYMGIPRFLKNNLNWPEKIQEWPA
jgi:protein gp37